MITISKELKTQAFDMVRMMQRERCEVIVRSHYDFIDELDPYEIAPQLPETIEIIAENCLEVAGLMFTRIEHDAVCLEGRFGIQTNDTLL